MNTTSHIVRIDTRTAGRSFGTVGIIRDAHGRKIAESATVRPFGFVAAAKGDAAALAASKGWTVRAAADRDDE